MEWRVGKVRMYGRRSRVWVRESDTVFESGGTIEVRSPHSWSGDR